MLAYTVLLILAAPLQAVVSPTQMTAAKPAQAEHVAIQASDIDRSAAFYHEAFGLRIIRTPLKNRRWLDLGHGMALHILDGRTAPKPSNRDEHLALHVDDLATVTAWLDAHHLAWTNFTGEPRTMQLRFDGVRQIYVQDPDGYWLEVGDSRGKPAQ
ncbi:VOC family protein [Sphingomonas sp. 22176]|uniref:VOC family protein n=1 Tax=Sphingomonas sp. 22176 TaxID=3453884 RepID=UPI003F857B92